jgi:hypothetical protein
MQVSNMLKRPHPLHAIGLVLASVVTIGVSACNKDDDDDDDDAADDESGGEDTDPSAGEATDPSAGEDTDPSAGEDTDPSAGEDTDPSAGEGAEDESSGDEASDDSSSGAADEGPGGEFSIAGTVGRSEAAAPFGDNDAIGDVYLVVFDDACGGNVVADGMAAAADLSDPATTVPFTIEGVGPGTYLVTGFLDDNGDYDPEDPGPNMGDIVMADGAMAGCVEVEIVDADAEGVMIVLNLALPFDPP